MSYGMQIGDRVAQQLLAKRLQREADEAAGNTTPSAPAMPQGGTGGGQDFDPGGQTQTEGFKAYRAGERMDYSKMMKAGLSGSKTFTEAEIKRGYRRLG